MSVWRMSVMQRWKFAFLLFGALTTILPGCALKRVEHASLSGITPEEVQLLHPIGRYVYQRTELSAEQAEWIRNRFAEGYLPSDGEVEYVHVRPHRNRGPHPRAYVFKAQGESAHGNFAILVCQSGGKVNEVYLLGGATADGAALTPSFLEQFAGMNALDPFEVDRLKSLPKRDDLSREVAEAIRRVLILGAALRL